MNTDGSSNGRKLGVRAFLKREGFHFGLKPHQIDQRLIRALSASKADEYELSKRMPDGEDRACILFGLAENLEQAHILFSHDGVRTVASFEWLAEVAAQVSGSILDLGCGTGAFARLLASRGKSQRIVGIEGAENLVLIARDASLGLANIEIRNSNYSRIDTDMIGDRFCLITSACALGWTSVGSDRGDDVHIDLCAPNKFVLSSSIRDQVSAVALQILKKLRTLISEGGQLAMVERLSTFQTFASFVWVAAQAGWKLDIDRSRRLRLGDESMPALLFTPADPHDVEFGLREYVKFWQGEVWGRFPVTDEAAILAYLERRPEPEDTTSQTFGKGTMFSETGCFEDGLRYLYRYATTGFRELRLCP